MRWQSIFDMRAPARRPATRAAGRTGSRGCWRAARPLEVIRAVVSEGGPHLLHGLYGDEARHHLLGPRLLGPGRDSLPPQRDGLAGRGEVSLTAAVGTVHRDCSCKVMTHLAAHVQVGREDDLLRHVAAALPPPPARVLSLCCTPTSPCSRGFSTDLGREMSVKWQNSGRRLPAAGWTARPGSSGRATLPAHPGPT